jgi:archaellum biogenesis ATPase FlaH
MGAAKMASPLESLRAPDALRDLKQWLVWKFEPNPKPGKKDLKVPYYAKSGTKRGWMPGPRSKKVGQGSPEELPLLVTFEEAKAAAVERGMTGVGLAMVDGCPVTALDFDHCVTDGVIHPDVEALIVGTYAEISPSGTGVRAFVKGNLGDRSDAHPDDGSFGFETYSSSRFVTFTGDMTGDTITFGCENEVSEPSPLLLETCEKRFGPRVVRQISIGKSDKERVGLTDTQIAEVLKWTAGGDHNRWMAVGMAVHHETEGEGEWLWDEWSQGIADYEGPDEIRYKWSTMGNYAGNEKTFWSVLREAQALGCPVNVDTASPDEFEALPMPVGGRFNIRSQGEFSRQVRSVRWIIKDFLPLATLGVIFGESGSGKSFLCYDLCAAVARGLEDWNGKRITKGRVLYVVAEGEAGFVNRINAYCHQQGISPDDFQVDYISDLTPNLLEPAMITDLIKDIKKREPYDMIVMDTFAQVMPGANENSGEDVGKALAECKRIHRHTGAMVLLVHHSGKDASKGARGWSGLRAAADVELEVLRADDMRSVSVTKLKDGQDGTQIGFKLHTVILGEDEDGDDITSCIVEYTDTGRVKATGTKRIGKNELLVLKVVHEVCGLEVGSKVPLETVLDAVVAQTAEPGRNTRGNANRSLKALSAKNSVFVEDGMVWVAESNA